ncbi:erythromycin esterase family protein [Deinococcus sp. DB0503]|uniref:erythromycin esterase family protein n=1 Tax=Deinococcus sp. DB0503 TaxID=2479203 RepID=UPI0018DFEAF6|nr:erythromycin esterase family protein [Deinococcus sp. DB0503]MBI0444512.1 erythromycin esterase family protein [Deinococcus sp. DB0503]
MSHRTHPETQLVQALREAARPLTGAANDYDALLDCIGNARFVLIGEASHGTHEFYRERARLTWRLIEEKGFTAVAVEADWPDAYRVNRYVRGQSADKSALEALRDFQRFPRWMWRNEDVQAFVSSLRDHNERSPGAPVGFYGLDLYSLHRSMNAVVEYLETVDPEAARRARQRYGCFDQFGENPQAYGYATESGRREPCEDAAVQQLLELQRREAQESGGPLAEDERFYAEQNARLAKNAETYYRAMFRGRDESWSLRDAHMAETLEALVEHGERQGRPQKIVVWAHNSHLGDARASEMGWLRGELNVGQLARERWPGETFIIGQSTYHGTVTAADDWDEPARVARVRPALPGSVEDLLHEVGEAAYWLDLREENPATDGLRAERLQRFIGVIYRPETERWSHYVHTRLSDMYDALLFFDETSAVVPLDATAGTEPEGEVPDTFPTGE